MIPLMTIADFGWRLRAGEITAAEITETCLRRIEADNPRLNAFILVMAAEARRDAAEADRELAAGIDRGPLHGAPVSIKDLFDVRGTPTTAASRVRDGHRATADAPVIARLRQAGAVIIGKTNLHEFAFGTTNEDSAYGPARNPHDPSRSPGGSSGGSAASVAAGMALATLGTDTGGSIRIPAAACGTVGLKPGYGEISTEGVVPLSRTLDHVGPLALTVSDARVMYRALRGTAAVDADAGIRRPLRLAVPRPYFCDLLDTSVRERFEASIELIRISGAVVDDVEIVDASLTAPVYMHLSFGDAAAYHADTLETMPERYTTPVRLRLEMARYVLAEDYVRALEGRDGLRRAVDRAMAGYDALVLPTLPIPAPLIGASSVQIDGAPQLVRSLMLRLTQLFDVTGHPAVSVPCGTAEGLPCGLQLVGPTGETSALLDVAAVVEKALARPAR
jgi:aspartyl-tRNA(Asn)/glutamyl-tRNA(Gln) amidotransferase subunit A